MIVFVDDAGNVSLRDPESFTSFKLVRRQHWSSDTAEVLFSDGHGWVSVEFLRDWGRAHASADWLEKLDGMVAYAGRKGWLSDDLARIRAHIEEE